MLIRRCVVIGLSFIVVLVGVLAACAAPAPTPSPTLTPTYTPTSTPTSTALAQIIEGAKKEGTVTVTLKSTFTPKSIERLQKEIKERFGVDLKIMPTLASEWLKDIPAAILEHRAGATPTYDLLTVGFDAMVAAFPAGAFQAVEWSSLLPPDVSPGVVVSSPYGELGVSYYDTQTILLYNPEKVRADQVPTTLSDLADPKWRGKVGLASYPALWARWGFIVGKDKVFADIRAILANKAIQGSFAALQNRYLLGEIWFSATGSSYWYEAKEKGVPAAWGMLDILDNQPRPLVLRTGAQHPNAAKLVALYLASAAGAKFTFEEGAGGNFCYPGYYPHEMVTQAGKQGVLVVTLGQHEGLTQFLLTGEFAQWEKEVDLIFKGR